MNSLTDRVPTKTQIIRTVRLDIRFRLCQPLGFRDFFTPSDARGLRFLKRIETGAV